MQRLTLRKFNFLIMIALFSHPNLFEEQDFSVKVDCMCLHANLLSQQEQQLCVFGWYCCSPNSEVFWGKWPLFKIIDWGIWYPSVTLAILWWNWHTILFLAILKIWTLLAVATLRLTLIFWNKPISQIQLFRYEWVPYSLATEHLQYWHLLIDLYHHLWYKDVFLDLNIHRLSSIKGRPPCILEFHLLVFHNKLPDCRSNCSQVLFKISVLKNLSIFTGKHLCWSLF